MENITFQYPSYFLLGCLLLGLLYAFLMYFRAKTNKDWKSWLPIVLGFLRTFAITLLASLLLAPLIKSFITESKKPVIVLAQDASESVGRAFSDSNLETYVGDLKKLEEQLGEKFDLKTYSFGKDLREGLDTSFNDKVTNISKLFNEVEELYDNQNLGAIVLATDGIYNEGSSPLYGVAKLGTPVYTIALGDTTPQKDLVAKRVLHNNIAYLGDKFTIQVDAAARNLLGTNSTMTVSKIIDGKAIKIDSKSIRVNKTDFFTTKEFVINADRAGIQRFRVTLSGVAGESTRANNSKDFFVDVLDARQKILILAESPHPDITAIKQSLAANKNYEITVGFAKDFQGSVGEFNFAILHQLPSQKFPVATLINNLSKNKTPIWYILGQQTSIPQINQRQPLFSIKQTGASGNEVTADLTNNFNLFNITDELKNDIEKYPPLTAAFGEYTTSSIGEVLLNQKIGRVETKYPLLSIGEKDGTKIGVLAGEGIWRWRLFDFLQNENHINFNELISKVVQYLSLKEDKRKFRTSLAKNIFKENEPVHFDAELYNQSYQLINTPEATITVLSATGKQYNFTFSKTSKAYTLKAGVLPVGSYTYTAKTSFNGQAYDASGQFSVEPIQLELFNTTADHGILNLLSEKFGGKLFSPNQIQSLGAELTNSSKLKPIIYQSSSTKSVIDYKWIALLALALLTLEWGIRRYFGTY